MSDRNRIMIVDDEADICYLLGCMLREKHYVTHAVHTLAAATATLPDYVPCLIFLDIHLPDGSGLHLVEQAKTLSPAPIIVLMSAYDKASEQKEGLLRGADFFIAKPFTHGDVCSVLDRFSPEM